MDLLDLINKGADTAEALDHGANLRESAEDFLAVLARFDGYSVVAASPHAERILGAAMMLNPSLQAGTSGTSVVVFDVTVASGTLMARAAQRVRDGGNYEQQLVGVALHCLSEGHHNWMSSELSELIVVDCESLTGSACWQTAESRNHGLVLAG